MGQDCRRCGKALTSLRDRLTWISSWNTDRKWNPGRWASSLPFDAQFLQNYVLKVDKVSVWLSPSRFDKLFAWSTRWVGLGPLTDLARIVGWTQKPNVVLSCNSYHFSGRAPFGSTMHWLMGSPYHQLYKKVSRQEQVMQWFNRRDPGKQQ